MTPLSLHIENLTQGIPATYSPARDDVVTLLILACFVTSSFVLSRSSKFLWELMKDFMNHRERSSIFSTSTGSDIRYLLLLILQTCVLSGTVVYVCTVDLNPSLLQHFSSTSLLSLFSASFLLYILLKWIVYSFIGRTFFDNSKTSLWMESYSTLLYYLGFTLFPPALFIVYFNLSIPVSIAIGVILVVFIKILMFYKWIKLFCNNLYGSLPIFVYFCALEIVPYPIIYRGMTQLIDYLIIKI